MAAKEVRVGDKVYRFPADMPNEEIQSILKAQVGSGESERGAPGTSPSAFESFVHALPMGLSFGFLDEIEAGGQSLMNRLGGKTLSDLTGRPGSPDTSSYEENLDWIKGQNRTLRETNPLAYLAGELAGGLFTGGAGFLRAAGRKGLTEALPRLAATGAVEGSVAGAGYSEKESLGGLGQDTLQGALFGTVLGTALPVAGAGIRGGLRAVNPFGPRRFGAHRRAAKTLNRDVEQAGLSEDDIMEGLARDPNLVTADLHPQLGERLGYAANQSPEVARAGRSTLGARQEGARGRLSGVFGEALGDTPTHEAAARIRREASESVTPLYETAYAKRITPSPAMIQILSTPAGQAAMKKVLRKFQNKTDLAPEDFPYTKSGETGKLLPDLNNLRWWDEYQRVLGDDVFKLKKTRPSDARDRRKMHDLVVGELEEQSNEWKSAREIWRGSKEAEEALSLGRKAFSEVTPNLEHDYGKMSASGKASFKLGVFEKIEDMMARKGAADRLQTIFKDPKKRTAISIAIGDKALERKFLEALGNEAMMEDTWRLIRNKGIIDIPDFYQAGITPASADQVVYRGARELLHRILRPAYRREQNILGDALLSRDPRGLISAGQRDLGALAGTGGVAAVHPLLLESPLLPSAQPPLPR